MLSQTLPQRSICGNSYLYFGCPQEWSTVTAIQYVSSLGKVQDTPQNWCLQIQIVVTESIAPAAMENKVVSY